MTTGPSRAPDPGHLPPPEGAAAAGQGHPLPGACQRSEAHAALGRVLPELERYGQRLVPEHRAGLVGVAGEDLVQFASVAVLSRLEVDLAAGNGPSPWWREDGHLLGYLRGIMWRRLKRVLRERRAAALPLDIETVAGAPAPAEIVRCEERARLRACLGGILPWDLRLFARFGSGRSYAELSSRSGLSPDALAKRRARALAELRERCQGCPLRRAQGCAWVPRGWLDTA